MIVLKFGGSSLAGPERIRAVARIVANHRLASGVVCVVSAMSGVTDALLRIADLATRHDTAGWQAAVDTLSDRHRGTLAALAGDDTAAAAALSSLLDALRADAMTLEDVSSLPPEARYHAVAAFSGWGERLSVRLASAALARLDVASQSYSSEPVIMRERHQPGPLISPAERYVPSVVATRAHLTSTASEQLDAGRVLILPGYIARTADGLVTTVGRNGSDYSAAIVAAALGAERVYIYSDVAGIHRADPHAVPKSAVLVRLTYADAADIAHAGAKVLHPGTLRPLAAAGIPLHLRSAVAPRLPGTDVSPELDTADGARPPWVVVARQLAPERTVYGVSFGHEPGLVEVQALYLGHAGLSAVEDDHLVADARPETIHEAAPEPAVGPISGALALLLSTPSPVGLAVSPRHISVAVPATDAVATQRRLYRALVRHDESTSARPTAGADEPPLRWRVPS